jgi:two-component system, NtrC family, nitrogen regulation sensor histidine kinase NtrY
MPATVTSITPRRPSGPTQPASSPRRPFRDNPRLILSGIALLIGVLAVMLAVANRTPRLSPDFLTEVVLYALSAADFTILFVFVWLLGRSIVKLVVERRRGLPFARFRSKLVALLLGMTLVPAVLVLLVGSELIHASVDRWFNAPMDEILASANQLAGDYYHERQVQVVDHATRIARELAGVDLAAANAQAVADRLGAERTPDRIQAIYV